MFFHFKLYKYGYKREVLILLDELCTVLVDSLANVRIRVAFCTIELRYC